MSTFELVFHPEVDLLELLGKDLRIVGKLGLDLGQLVLK